MPQLQLPLFPAGVSHITAELAFIKRDGQVMYFNGQMPVFVHDEDDLASFRMITSQFYINGNAKQVDIVRAFGVSPISVKRTVKLYREQGPKGFYLPPRRRGAAVLTAPVVARGEQLFAAGHGVSAVAEQLELKADTLRKAVAAGRVRRAAAPPRPEETGHASSKSQRSADDSTAAMGMGATNTLDRVAASLGMLHGVGVAFRHCLDVPNGGLLLALPALLHTGLLHNISKHFSLPKGYYRLDSLFMLLAFLALSRLRSLEALRYLAPGEWGKLLGLDRVPEVRTLHRKLPLLARDGQAQCWSAELSAAWMAAEPQAAGVLYVDGHVRVYHGAQTQLPKHYVARQRLCLRATTDYWVNAADGQPFFVVHSAVDPGLLQVLEQEIVPRLEHEVPGQPSPEALAAERWRHRFTLVFDREGYSPDFLRRMRKRRIACLTYRKRQGEDWPREEFFERQVTLVSGNRVDMRLAERGILLSGKLWLREIRRLTKGGHQTAILATDYRTDMDRLAAAMFARWSQENFFRYARQHYGLDRLVDYGTEDIPETTKTVNPAWRQLDGQVRKLAALRTRKHAEFGAITLEGEINPAKLDAYQQKQADLREQIEDLEARRATLKRERKKLDHHILVAELPEQDQFKRLAVARKHFVDTIKLVAYRAETAMANTLRQTIARHDDARSLLRAIYDAEADLLPDETQATLTVRLHHMANDSADQAIRHLCAELNATDTKFPSTDLRLVYDLVSSQNPGGQEV